MTRLLTHATTLALLLLPGCDRCGGPDDDTAQPGYASAWVLMEAGQAHQGPLALAVPGDMVLENDLARFTLQQPGRAIALNPFGGTLIDAGVVDEQGGAWDRFGELGLFLNAAFTMDPDSMEIIDDGASGEAVVRFSGPAARSGYIDAPVGLELMMGLELPIDTLDVPPWQISVTYRLPADQRHLLIEVEVENSGSESTPMAPAWMQHGGLAENYYPALGGFTTLPTTTLGALLPLSDETAYGFAPLPYQPGTHSSAYMAGGSVLLEGVNLFEVLDWPDAAPVLLAPGESYAFDATFVASDDLSGVLSVLRSLAEQPEELATISGTVTVEGTAAALPYTAIVARDPDTRELLSATRADADGAYSLQLPSGPAELLWARTGWPFAGGSDEPELREVAAQGSLTEDLQLPETGILMASVVDSEGDPLPARLAVVGFDPSPSHAAFDWRDLDPLPPGVSALVDLPPAGRAFYLEPGEYDLVFTRGMEYDAVIEPLIIAGGEETQVQVTLNRVLDTEGMLSGDFHNHSAAGPDLICTDTERLYNLAAEGLEVRAETNHAFVTDLSELTAELGLDPWLASIPSQEITPFDYGHFSVFPMDHEPSAANGGAFDWEGVSPTEIFDWAQQQDHDTVVHIYHPRAIPTSFEAQNFFTVLDLLYDEDGWYFGPDAYDPMGTGLPGDALMFGPGFTAMEVMTWMNVQGLSDWFNLLSAGYVFTATANSDTHTLRVESSGWPRNFVQVGSDDPAMLDVDAYVEAVNSQRVSGSFGPLVTLEAATASGSASAEQGELLSTGGEMVILDARVQAAPWVPVDTLDIYADGTLVYSEALAMAEVPGAEGGVRREQIVSLEITLTQDSYLAAVVSSESGLFPYVPYNESDDDELTLEDLRAGAVVDPAQPFGFANPIFIDADGDGLITPSHNLRALDHDSYRWEDRLAPY